MTAGLHQREGRQRGALDGEVVAQISYKENEKLMDNDYADSRGFLEVYCMMVCVIDKNCIY